MLKVIIRKLLLKTALSLQISQAQAVDEESTLLNFTKTSSSSARDRNVIVTFFIEFNDFLIDFLFMDFKSRLIIFCLLLYFMYDKKNAIANLFKSIYKSQYFKTKVVSWLFMQIIKFCSRLMLEKAMLIFFFFN